MCERLSIGNSSINNDNFTQRYQLLAGQAAGQTWEQVARAGWSSDLQTGGQGVEEEREVGREGGSARGREEEREGGGVM
jgi:hypothetical protein